MVKRKKAFQVDIYHSTEGLIGSFACASLEEAQQLLQQLAEKNLNLFIESICEIRKRKLFEPGQNSINLMV